MPCIGSANGISFYVYAADHNPPHVHAYHGDHAALLVIATCEVYAGALPKPQMRQAKAWLQANSAYAADEWDRLNP